MPSTLGQPGSGPGGILTVDDLRLALADQPGDAGVFIMDAHDPNPVGVVVGVEPVLNDPGRILVYLVTHVIEGGEH